MNRKTLTITVSVALLAISLTCSCKIEHKERYNTYMTAVATDSSGIEYLVSDDSIKLFPTRGLEFLSQIKHNDRLFGTFSIPLGEVANPMAVEFSHIQLLYKDTIVRTSRRSAYGTDPIEIIAAWHGGGVYGAGRFLTMSTAYNESNHALTHQIYLVNDSTVANPDSNGYWHLFLTHNANNDPALYSSTTILTYPLTDADILSSDVKGLKINYLSARTDKDTTVTVTF